MMPTFVGVGAQKCASTWLHRILVDHPQAWVSEPKELDFFSHSFDRGYQWYENFFAEAGAARAVGEISPSYFPDHRVAERVRSYNPDARIIIAVRDPVERAYSNHLHDVRIGNLRGEDQSFERGLANNPMYLEQSRYAKHMKPWLDAFQKEQLIVFFQEEIKADPVVQARRLYDFLGIDGDHESASLHKRSNESVGSQIPAVDWVLRRSGRIGRQLGLGAAVSVVKESRLVTTLRDANRRDLRSVLPAMKPETVEALQQELASDVVEFARLLGRDDLPWKTWDALVRSGKSGADDTISAVRM